MIKIREINPNSKEEIELVATRMRSTLIDVLGEEKGSSMYSMDWLRDRVKWHLNLGSQAKVLLVENIAAEITAHAIVREENNPKGKFGYFSTIYVAPESRDKGIAKTLINAVEIWCRQKNLPYMVYNTAENNHRLIELFKKFSFEIVARESDMVQLKKILN